MLERKLLGAEQQGALGRRGLAGKVGDGAKLAHFAEPAGRKVDAQSSSGRVEQRADR